MTETAMKAINRRLADGGIVILDGGTGTELERRGAPMHDGAWCAMARFRTAISCAGCTRITSGPGRT